MAKQLSRRQFLKISAGSAALAGLAACATPSAPGTGAPGGAAPAAGSATAAPAAPAVSSGKRIRIGYVTPQTGALAPFGETDAFITAEMAKIFASGMKIGDSTYAVEILVKDSQSDPNKAAENALNLITKEGVNIMMVAQTPETTNPVADQCEANGMPLISANAPWQPWFFRNKDASPDKPYHWTYHFFWGLEDIIGVFTGHWANVPTNKVIGALWPNDGDGLAWSDKQRGFPPALTKAGFTIIDAGRYANLKDDFSAEISLFKKNNVEIVTGVMLPPDLGTFLTQSAQQGFKPKAFTVGKAALFPGVVEAIPNGLGTGLTTEVWWSPFHPFKSSLTGQSAQQLADAYTAATKKQWSQPVGFVHAQFEVLNDVMKRAGKVDDKEAIVTAIKATNLDTIAGNVNWSKGPVPNVAKTPLVGGQWVKGSKYPFELVLTENSQAPNIPCLLYTSPSPRDS